jgi:ELWxxDGT repeat protein
MRTFPVLALALCLSTSAFGQSPYLAVDLDTTIDQVTGSKPYFLETVNGVAVFLTKPSSTIAKLWRTDGSAAGTYELLELRTGPVDLGVSPFGYFVSGNQLYFGAAAESFEWAIWRTDGTVAGTAAVTGMDGDEMTPLAVDNGRIFHLRERTRELWVTDAAGDRRLATLRNATSSLNVPAIWRGHFYFGMEGALWKSDGTPEGTVKVVSQTTFGIAIANDALYFSSFRPDAGGELFTTDGTEAGTRLVADIRPGVDSTFGFGSGSALRSLGNRLFWRSLNGDIGVSDGTAGGTRALVRGGRAESAPVAVLNGVAYFPFDDGQHGRELWRSDGTDAGTRMVIDGTIGGSSTIGLIAAGASKIFFYGSMGEHQSDVFESDGTAAGTRLLPAPRTPLWKGVRESGPLVTAGDTVFFAADDGLTGNEPWVSMSGDTHLIANIAREAAGSSDLGRVIAAGNRLFFQAKDDTGRKLWVSDGTRSGTQALLDVPDSSTPLEPIGVLGSTVFFKQYVAKLYKSDGTREGTVLVKDFGQGSIARMSISAGRAYLIARGTSGWELWTTDGTAAGTIRLHADASFESAVVELAGRSYFIDDEDAVNTTDGTIAGTRVIAALPRDESGGELVAFRGALYFFGRKLWRLSTGTGDLTAIVDLQSSVTSVASIGTELLFLNSAGELWKTNGTAAGTMKVRDMPRWNIGYSMTGLYSLGNRVVFAYSDAQLGYEPWVSDGTAEGTRLLRDIHRNDFHQSSYEMEFFVADGIAYFGAISTESGWELWQTDGTPEGTTLTADIAPGPEWSIPLAGEFARIGNTMYFGAMTSTDGRELWAYPLPERVSVRIDDARVTESEGGATLTVRLSRAFPRRVTVSYETLDETARAGSDYTAASGSLTFEPGETSKSLDILIADDAAPNGVRTLLVKLSTADAALERSLGAVVIEDDDVVADLSLSLASSGSGKSVVVTNVGPSAASNVVLCVGFASATESGAMECAAPAVLAPGAAFSKSLSPTRGVIVASVTHLERDPSSANNRKSWLIGTYVHADPAVPVAGTIGTLIVSFPTSSQSEVLTWSSSDPSVVSVPAEVTYPANATSIGVGFNALKAGTATITMTSFGWGTERVTIRVIDASQSARLIPVVSLESFTAWTFGASNIMTVRVHGATADDARPSGTVTLFDGATAIGTVPVVDRKAVFALTAPPLGTRNYTATYSGDANFFDASSPAREVFVRRGTPSIRAVRVDDSTDVLIIVSGVPSHAPAGTVTVASNPARTLAPWNASSTSATVSGVAATARTISVVYSGDDKYNGASVTIPIASARGRAVRH